MQGVLGGLFGIALGVAIALVIDAFGPTLTASSTTGGSDRLLGLGAARPRAPPRHSLAARAAHDRAVVIGFGLALLGGLLAGAAGALRAARLRPADALRQME